jgi:hypothetical protein
MASRPSSSERERRFRSKLLGSIGPNPLPIAEGAGDGGNQLRRAGLMFWFVTYSDAKNETVAKRFFTQESLWEWMGKFRDEHNAYPADMCVYKADCVFDGS